MIDLHTHSTASDGEFSPTELVLHAQAHDVTVLALTDHDTTSGLEEARNACAGTNVTLVPGIELNIEWPQGGEFHLLGLGLKRTAPALEKTIAFLRRSRAERNKTVVQKMKDDGIPIDYDELCAAFDTPCLGRPHIAAYLAKKGVVKNTQKAFDLYLGNGRPYYVDRTGANLHDAIFAIQDSGGVPVLAHPLSLYLSWGKMEDVLAEFRESGIEGVEAWHPGARVVEAERLEKLARKLGFFVTAGSDFHGVSVRGDRRMGHTAGKYKIDGRFYTEELLPALTRH